MGGWSSIPPRLPSCVASSVISCGLTPFQIAKVLTAESIPTPAGKTQWSYTTVRRVLSNEAYMGDKLLQKTYSIDFLSKDMLKKHGEVPQCIFRSEESTCTVF